MQDSLVQGVRQQLNVAGTLPTADFQQQTLEESKTPLDRAATIYAEFMAYKQAVSVREFHHAMTVFEYYVQCQFDKTRYPKGMSADPVEEIAKSLRSNRIKAFFVAGVEYADAYNRLHEHCHLQADVMVFPPYYTTMQDFRSIMQRHSQEAGAEGRLQKSSAAGRMKTRSGDADRLKEQP